MKIVIVGAGVVGQYLCEILSEHGHDITLIESAEQIAQEVDERTDVRVVEGNGASATTLKAAGVSDSDFFLAMTSDDLTNLISSSIAKVLGTRTTITRIHDQTYSDNTLINYQHHFGIDYLINPEALSAVELAKLIRSPGGVSVENFAQGAIEVQQVEVSSKAKLANKQLKDIRLGKGVYIGLIQREGEVEVPTPESVLSPGSNITLFGETDSIINARQKLNPERLPDVIRIALFGGSETAIGLVRLLQNPRYRIRIIERDAKKCQHLAERFPEVTVIHGSATSLRLMEEEQIGSCDYFISCTKNVEYNIMTCLQAKKLGVKHVQLVINKPDYEDVLDSLNESIGVELAVSPRKATINEIIHYISEDPYIMIANLPENTGMIIEVKVGENSPMINKQIRDIPAGIVVVVLRHKYKAKLPTADDTILHGDRLVTIVRNDKLKKLIELMG